MFYPQKMGPRKTGMVTKRMRVWREQTRQGVGSKGVPTFSKAWTGTTANTPSCYRASVTRNKHLRMPKKTKTCGCIIDEGDLNCGPHQTIPQSHTSQIGTTGVRKSVHKKPTEPAFRWPTTPLCTTPKHFKLSKLDESCETQTTPPPKENGAGIPPATEIDTR